MKFKGRSIRVATLIKEEIAKLVTKGLKDPRIGFVSIMDVRMSNDLRYANVYVSLFGSESERKSSLIGLQHSAGWIRHEVGKYLHIRVLPEIRFFPDDTLDKVYHLEEVFETIHAEHRQQPMLALSFEEIIAVLREANVIYIAGHQSPDGDAIGSMLALRLLLLDWGKTQVVCAVDDVVPRMYLDLPGARTIVNADAPPPDYDLAVIVDCGQRHRIGELANHIPEEKRLLVLDHHLEPGEAGASGIVDNGYAAAGEIIAELYFASQTEITRDAALCLYTALATDTGCFRFSNTTAKTHRTVAALLETGIEVGPLNKRFFSDMNRTKYELLRRALTRTEFHADGAVALSWLNSEDLEETGARLEDAENLINFWNNVEGVRVAILLKQFDPEKTRVSFRSDSRFDSAEFLRRFDGGGHAPAAGATLEMPLVSAREMILAALLERFANDAPEQE